MHTIVVISNNPSIDMDMRNAMETLFAECRMEILNPAEWRNLQRVDANKKIASVPFENVPQ